MRSTISPECDGAPAAPFVIRRWLGDNLDAIGQLLSLPEVAVPYFGCVLREAELVAHLSEAWHGVAREPVLLNVAMDEVSGQVVGGARIHAQRISYFVHPAFWRRGIASALIRGACMQAATEGMAMISALIDRSNHPSIAAVERAGFRFSGLEQARFGIPSGHRAMVRYTMRT